MLANIVFFANSEEHAIDVLTKMFEATLNILKNKKIEYDKTDSANREKYVHYRAIRTLDYFLKCKDKIKVSEVKNNIFMKVAWADNDLLIYESMIMSDSIIYITKSELSEDNSQSKLEFKRYHFDFVVWETDKAFLVRKQDKEYWLPKSLCYKLNYEDEIVSVYLPSWFNIDNSKVNKESGNKSKSLAEYAP